MSSNSTLRIRKVADGSSRLMTDTSTLIQPFQEAESCLRSLRSNGRRKSETTAKRARKEDRQRERGCVRIQSNQPKTPILIFFFSLSLYVLVYLNVCIPTKGTGKDRDDQPRVW